MEGPLPNGSNHVCKPTASIHAFHPHQQKRAAKKPRIQATTSDSSQIDGPSTKLHSLPLTPHPSPPPGPSPAQRGRRSCPPTGLPSPARRACPRHQMHGSIEFDFLDSATGLRRSGPGHGPLGRMLPVRAGNVTHLQCFFSFCRK